MLVNIVRGYVSLNIMKLILNQLHNTRLSEDYFLIDLGTYIETTKVMLGFFNNVRYQIIAYDNKKHLALNETHTICDKLELYINLNKCKMMVFSADDRNITTFLYMFKRVKEFCISNACYGAIFILDMHDILLFPNIYYQDSYLIKHIISKQMSCTNIQISFLSNNNNFVFV